MERLPEQRPTAARRAAAAASLFLVGGVLVATVVSIADDLWFVLAQVALLACALLAAWRALTRVGPQRALAAAIAAASVAAILAVDLARERTVRGSLLIRLLALGAGLGFGRYALGTTTRSLKQSETPGTPVGPARRGVLIMNLRSGGGKAERFELVRECQARGIEPIVLGVGDDLLQLANDAADRGADVIGMAGGDGSQALVASVAAERGIPMVVVPAGTRNHLALDLGLDRNDVVGALDAFGVASERPIDLADVNGTVFVNNVSLGLYAAIVRSPEYRDAKRDTTLAALPQILGPGSEPFDLRFSLPDGSAHRGAHLIQVSNNPYGQMLSTAGSRPRLDTGQLGVVTLEISGDREASRFLAALATGQPDRFAGFHAWSTARFEVGSASTIDVGLDGETTEMEPPLIFAMRPRALRVRVPTHAIGHSPAALKPGFTDGARALWRTALGRSRPDDAY